MTMCRAGVSALLALVPWSPQASADVIYGIDNGGIYAIDVDAHTVTLQYGLGPFFSPGWNLAVATAPETLYFQNQTGELYQYEIGASWPIPLTGTPLPSTNTHYALGEDGDGHLYLAGQNDFGRVDLNPVQYTSIAASPQFAGDIATSPAGITYGSLQTQHLVQIDTATGQQTQIGLMAARMWGLAFTRDGRMWATNTGGTIYRVDPLTGTSTVVFNSGREFLDLASQPVPSPGGTALLISSFVLTRRLRRSEATRSGLKSRVQIVAEFRRCDTRPGRS
jgi:hypothetical protein